MCLCNNGDNGIVVWTVSKDSTGSTASKGKLTVSTECIEGFAEVDKCVEAFDAFDWCSEVFDKFDGHIEVFDAFDW